MIELGYRYCDLDKTHQYSVVALAETSIWCQWLWHWLEFRHTKKVHLMGHHCTWDGKAKILARYKGTNARTVAGHISKKIEQHRMEL